MKLKKVTQNDPVERLAVSVRQSTMQLLGAYQAHYAKTYGEDIERSHLVEEMLRDYMMSDKDFAKAVSTPQGAPAKKAPKAPAA